MFFDSQICFEIPHALKLILARNHDWPALTFHMANRLTLAGRVPTRSGHTLVKEILAPSNSLNDLNLSNREQKLVPETRVAYFLALPQAESNLVQALNMSIVGVRWHLDKPECRARIESEISTYS